MAHQAPHDLTAHHLPDIISYWTRLAHSDPDLRALIAELAPAVPCVRDTLHQTSGSPPHPLPLLMNLPLTQIRTPLNTTKPCSLLLFLLNIHHHLIFYVFTFFPHLELVALLFNQEIFQ